VALAGAAIALMAFHGTDFTSAAARLRDVGPAWILAAVLAEAASLVAFAALQRRLLRAGGAELPWSSVVAITSAGNALDATLPVGIAWAAAWLFEQYGRRGVRPFVRLWFFLVAGGVSSFALFVVVALGLELAGSRGPVSFLRWPVLFLAAIPVVFFVLELTRATATSGHILRFFECLGLRSRRMRIGRRLHRVLTDFSRVRLGSSGWLTVFTLALANWLLDAAVLATCLEALGVRLDWRYLLIVYGLTQITAAIPVTPGGVGIVVGSLTGLLVAYGAPLTAALSAVLLYRLVTFWVLVPIGWCIWGYLEVRSHHRPARYEGDAAPERGEVDTARGTEEQRHPHATQQAGGELQSFARSST
jgi:uncharacterized membrane protein YbhN (UPF0104 family)